MRKILLFTFALCLLSIAHAQLKEGGYFNGPSLTIYNPNKIDTVRCILKITNSKLNKLQPVPGYVIISNGLVKGYLSRRKKPLPKKVEVWGYE
jgi:hypothetical protein